MVTEFEEWAFKDHVTGDADIVETQFGYHVIKFEKREVTKYDDVKESIKSTLVYSKFGEDFTKKMDEWKKDPKFAIVKNESVLTKIDKILYGV
jgi:foldase protein PrsA